MSKYAENTSVPIERSKVEIERTLIRYGAEEFFYGTSSRGSGVGFKYKGRVIKMNIPMPDRKKYPANQSGETKWMQAQRQLWRVLLLALKAKLELVDNGLTTFEDEFLAQTCLPGGGTISQHLQPQIDKMVESGKMPDLLLLTDGKG
ncbi:MAG: hypothetical protein ABSG99_02790 [Sedimentisphaerales bacterium]